MTSALRRTFIRTLDQEPMIVLSLAVASIGAVTVLVAPPVRRALGYDTTQYDGVDVHHERRHVERGSEAVYERQGPGGVPKLKQ